MPASEPKTLYLIDANGYIHRAYHALPPLTNSKGEPVGALFGFARMLQKILRQYKPDYLAVCFDTAAPTFRHKAYADYKATRKKTDDALVFQLPLARDMAEAWGLPVCGVDGYEADDVIATLAQQGVEDGLRVVIVTADKDALQMVDDKISVLNEGKNLVYTPEEVEKKYGLKPGQLVDYFALLGDASDNVPGVPGVGEKTATQILQQYGTLEKALAHTGEIKGSLGKKLEANKDQAIMSKQLVTLDRRVPLGLAMKDCVACPADAQRLQGLLKRFEFNALLGELAGSAAAGAKSERRVRVVQSDEDFQALSRALTKAGELSVDVETTGLYPLASGLVGISLAVKPGEAWYVPVGHLEVPDRAAALARARAVLGPFLADEKLPKIGHNLKFDLLVLRRNGLPVNGLSFDTLLASYCLNPSRQSHGLKDLARDVLGEFMTPISDLIGKGAKQITMDQVPVRAAADYAGADAEVTLRLKQDFAPRLTEMKLEKLFHDVEMPVMAILADMEETGLRVDMPYLEQLRGQFEKDIAGLEKKIHDLAGQEFNLNSSRQLSFLLFEKLKLPVVRRTKTGYSTDEDVLQKLSAQHALPAQMVRYRELAKLKSTYIDALLGLADPKTHRVHTSFNQAVAATGRLSSSDPNLQNIPIRTEEGRRIRRAFVPEKGWVFLSADYSQIDLRVLAHIAGDQALTQAFRQGGDIHTATARDIFHLEPGEAVTDDQRRVAKSVNFGIVYGQTAFGLSQQLGIELAQAKDYIEKYFARYPGVKKWMEEILEKARRDGYVTTLLNRVRYLPEIKAPNQAVRAFAERTAMNTPIQGTSADIIKVAMRDIAALLRKKKSPARMVLQVHDDLLFETPADQLQELGGLVRGAMENAVKLDVPLLVDLKTGPHWASMEKLK